MAPSHYNAIHERILAADLSENDLRLAIAFVRCLLGWRRKGGVPNEGRLGRAHLMSTARITDRRTFERARDKLVQLGIIEILEPGKPGRGNRTLYRLVLDPSENAAPERPNQEDEKAGLERPKRETEKGRSGGTKKAAPERPRKGYRKGKTPETTGQTDITRRAFDAYLGAGGELQLDRERGALARQVASLVKAGVDEGSILAACRECGTNREFPGYITQRAKAIAADGGPCEWEKLGRSNLTADQLRECGCERCTEWLTFREEVATA